MDIPNHLKNATDQGIEQEATILRDNGQEAAAIALYAYLRERYKAQGDFSRAATMQQMIGVAHNIANHIEPALTALAEAKSLYESAGDVVGIGRVLRDLGITYLRNDDYEHALPLLEQSVETLRQTDATAELGISEAKVGNFHLLTGNVSNAETWIRQGIETLQTTDHWAYTATATLHLAQLLFKKQKDIEALETIDQAESIYTINGGATHNARRYAEMEGLRGLISMQQDNTKETVRHRQLCESYLAQLDDASAAYLREHDLKTLFS